MKPKRVLMGREYNTSMLQFVEFDNDVINSTSYTPPHTSDSVSIQGLHVGSITKLCTHNNRLWEGDYSEFQIAAYYFKTLSVARLHTVELQKDRRMMNWKGFGRKWWWLNRGTIPAFA
jgi:hypothetical protein